MIKTNSNFMKSVFFNKQKVENLLTSNNIEFNSNDHIYILSRALQIHLKGSLNIDISLDKCIDKLNLTKRVLITPYSYNLSVIEFLGQKCEAE